MLIGACETLHPKPLHDFQKSLMPLQMSWILKQLCKNNAGVDEVQTDQYNQKVTVVGMVEPEDVLKRVKRIKKRSELWTHEYSYSNIWSSRNQALTSPHTSSSIPIYGAPYIKSTFDQISYSQSAYGPSYIETTYDHATPSYNQVYDSY